MRTIEFKKLPKELTKEGITIDLLNQVQQTGKFSPAIFQEGEDPVNLVRCNDEFFWVQLDDKTFLKDGKSLVKFDIKTCIIARARYWLLFSDKEMAMDSQRREAAKSKEIQAKVEEIKKSLTQQVKELSDKLAKVTRFANTDERDTGWMILNSYDPELAEKKQSDARQWVEANQDTIDWMETINSKLKAGDFDWLYMTLETNGLPLLATLKTNNAGDIQFLKNKFLKNRITETLLQIAEGSHIENVARLEIERKYTVTTN